MQKQIIKQRQYVLSTLAAFLGLSSCANDAMVPAPNDPHDNTESTESVRQGLYTWVPPECGPGSPCDNQGIPDAIRRASIKYNIPRWFYFLEAQLASHLNADLKTGSDSCGTDDSTGFGLMQLTNPDHAGVPYPYGLPNPDPSYPTWQTNMKISEYCAKSGLCPWIDMKNVTPLSDCNAWKDPFANLDRFSSGFAAPMYNYLKTISPGTSSDVLLRQVAYYWIYGLFGPYDYPNDPYYRLDDYDWYVAQYKPAVERDDDNGGSWNGVVCTPPYSSLGCSDAGSSFLSIASPSPSCLVAGTGTTSIQATFKNTKSVVYNNAMLDMEVWDGTTKIGQSYRTQSIPANGTTSWTWDWPAPMSAAQPKKDYTVKLGVFNADWSQNPHWNATAATISVSPDTSQYNFECGNMQNWQFVPGHSVASIESKAMGAYSGTHALAVQFTAAAGTTDVSTSTNPLPTVAGTPVTFHVLIARRSGILAISPFIKQGAKGGWTWTSEWVDVSGAIDSWFTVVVKVPTNAVFPLDSIGVEFITTSDAAYQPAYIDAVTW